MDIVAGVTIILFFIYFITREKKEKKIIKIFAVAFFIALISIGCASLEAEESETKNKVAKVEKLEEKRKKGIKLELNDVSEENQGDKNINPSNVEEINKAKEPINKKSSNLHIQDYLEGVNELSWENIELYIMRRPGFEEGKDYEVYDYYLTTPEHLLIDTDKNDNIMQITWESEEPLGQDESSNLEWIILSLDEDISIEEVNDFLVSKEFVEKNFGDFKVEFINYGSSFKFNAYIE